MITDNRNRQPTVLLLIWVCLMVAPVYSQSKQVLRGMPEEAKQHVKELYALVRPDYRGRLQVVDYDAEAVERALAALDDPNFELRTEVLLLIKRMLGEWEMPPEAVDAIERKVRGVIEEQPWLFGQWRTIEWELRFVRARSQQDRWAIARDGFKDVVPWALDYVVEVGGEEAKRLLREAQRRFEKYGSSETAYWLELGLKRIEVNEALAKLHEGERSDHLWDVFQQYGEGTHRWQDDQFVLWIIDKLEVLDTPEAAERLKQLYQTKLYEPKYRYAAQEVLVKKGVMLPTERRVHIHGRFWR